MAYAIVKKSTRQSTVIKLIGKPNDSLPNTQLPTIRQVLQLYFFHHKINKKTVRESSIDVIEAMEKIWKDARIPIIARKNVIIKLEKVLDKYTKLMKSVNKQTEVQRRNEEIFQNEIDFLFDIAQIKAMELITIEEDRKFLLDQRGERNLHLGGVDVKLAKREKSLLARQLSEHERTEREILRKKKSEELIELSASSSTSSSGAESNEMFEDFDNPREGSSKAPAPKRHKHIMTPALTAALDRAKVSDRMAVHTVAAAAVGLGHQIDKFSISHSTVNRLRKMNRQLSYENMKKDFNPDAPLVVHWDGKLLPDITERETVERLPILVTGTGTEMLLGVPKLKDGTGETVASAVLETLLDWDADLINKISGMSFDTTPSNTGHQAGACVLLEKKIAKPLLHLACRHHIMEIVIGEVSKKCFGVTSGPVIPIFKRFKEGWKHIKQDSYKSAKEDPKCLETLNSTPNLNNITEFVQLALLEKQPRNDYKELLELTLYFLGEKSKEVHFMAPGAYCIPSCPMDG